MKSGLHAFARDSSGFLFRWISAERLGPQQEEKTRTVSDGSDWWKRIAANHECRRIRWPSFAEDWSVRTALDFRMTARWWCESEARVVNEVVPENLR